MNDTNNKQIDENENQSDGKEEERNEESNHSNIQLSEKEKSVLKHDTRSND